MPRHSTVLQVFVASPADVQDERLALEAVVKELNATWSRSLGVVLELLKWETHVRPGFAQDAQAVVNEQMPTDYDVFIGIFWSRAGTPTARAASGSIEEFESAFARRQSTGSTPELMVYFKDAPLHPSKIDPTQLLTLQEFRASLQNRGGLLSVFEDIAGFEASVRAHLSAIAQKFAKASEPTPRTVVVSPAFGATVEESPEDDFGLFDLMDIYSNHTRDMTVAMEAINEAIVRMGEQVSERGRELSEHGPLTEAHKRRVVKRAAEDMLRFATAVDTHLPTLSAARQGAFSALGQAIPLMADFATDPAEVSALSTTLNETVGTSFGIKPSIASMRLAVSSVPRISRETNQAKRAVIASVDRFVAELDTIESTAKNIVESLDQLHSALRERRTGEDGA